MKYNHISVMLKEVIEYLQPKKGQVIVDCTLGGAGYTIEIAKQVGNGGKVIAIDADKVAIQNAEKILKNKKIKNVILINDNFSNLQKIIQENKLEKVDACVFDLGLSSYQLQDRSRGFSFGMDEALSMAFDGDDQEKTFHIVNKYSKQELQRIIKEYGEEKFSGRITEAIIKARPINSAKQLAEVIYNTVPVSYQKGRINPATRTFQALRIETNQELVNLEKTLSQALNILKPNGRLVVVSFHSLEDRIVKNIFRQEASECICDKERLICDCEHQPSVKILTKKPITPTAEEIKSNPRARSAKLRAIEKI